MNNLRTVFTSVFTAVLLCITVSGVHAQTVISKVVPETTSFASDLVAPNGLAFHTNLRTHFILRASEINLPAGTNIRSIGFKFAGGTEIPSNGNIKFYLENSANTVNAKSTTWAIAISSMSGVYSGIFDLPTGVIDEATVSVNLQSGFVYTGGSLYIAYEYSGTSFAGISARAYVNNNLANATKYGASNGAPMASLSGSDAYRPQIILGYDNPQNYDLEVRQLNIQHTLGKYWAAQNPVIALVRNNSNQARNNIVVTMNVSGANTATETTTIPAIAAGDSVEVNFEAPSTIAGTQTIQVSVGADNDNSNNSYSGTQTIDCSSMQFASGEFGFDSVGFAGSSGIVAVKYPVPQVPIRVDAVTFRVSRDAANIGESVTAVIVDEYGSILTSSDPFVMDASMQGKDQVLQLTAPAYFQPGETFYAGILQESGNNLPVATAFPKKTPPGISYTFDPTGGIGTETTTSGTFIIGIQSSTSLEFTSSVLGKIMEGTQAMFVASGGFTNYNFKVNGVSKYSGVDNFFIYYPANGDIVTLEVEIYGCSLTSDDSFTMDVSPIVPGTGNILYVDRHAPAFGDGSSWQEPLAELSDALRWAKARESSITSANPLKIFVAGGMYKPLYSALDETFGMDGGPNNAFLMVKNVQLYGNFAGTESSLAERDLSIATNKTYLSGDYSDDDMLYGDGTNLTIANTMENTFHVVIASGDVGNAVLDGFTITGSGGELFGQPWEVVNNNQIMAQYGGGLYIHASSPTINNIVLTGNKAEMFGGGIYLAHSSASISNTLIFKNYAGISGAGVYNDINTDAYFTNLTISNNRANTSGSAIANSAATPHLRNSILYGNGSGIDDHNSTTQVEYSLVQGMPANAANHNIDGSTNPMFNDMPGDDYTLKSASSLVNKGNNLYFQTGQTPDLSTFKKDLNGKLRIGENNIDLGAFEAKPTLDIIQHPASITSCQGTEVNFVALVSSSGASNPSYQWQQSEDNNTFTDIPGATDFTYLLKAGKDMYFRCIIGIPGFTVTTNSAKLTTTPFEKPVITIPDRICLGQNSIMLTASPAGGVFSGDGVDEDNWSLLGFKAGSQTVTYTYTSSNGCTGSSEKTVILESCTGDGTIKVFQVTPNPTKGLIKVRIEMGKEIREAELIISSLNGQWVMRRPVKLSRGTNIQEFDLSELGAGVYFVSIYSHFKKPIGTVRLIKM